MKTLFSAKRKESLFCKWGRNFMKKLISVLLSVLLILLMITSVSAEAQRRYVEEEREIHVFGGITTATVIIKDGVTMIPFDDLGFYLGAGTGSIKGNPALFGLTLFGKEYKIGIKQGTATAFLNDEQITMPQASFLYSGKLYVPLTFVAESLGYLVYWREQTQTIYIQRPEYYAEASKVIRRSLESIEENSFVTTSYENYTNLSSDQPERYFVESKGVMHTDMKNSIAQFSY